MYKSLLLALAALGVAGACSQAEPSEEQPALPQLVDRILVDYDRGVANTCKCLAAQGAYDSFESCYELLRSGPDWADCAIEVLQDADQGLLDASVPPLEQLEAEAEAGQARTECIERANCDLEAETQCPVEGSLNLANYPELGTVLLIRCPDLALLSRVSG